MGKKKGSRGRPQREQTVMSIYEFNQKTTVGHSPSTGLDSSMPALLSAPKTNEEWEAEGGRPSFNSRGYRERSFDASFDDDVDERDWRKRRPSTLDDDEERPDRDWGSVRRGPVDAETPRGGDEVRAERDWAAMRRGSVDAGSPRGGDEVPTESNWSAMRRGPVDTETPCGGDEVRPEHNWAAMRRGPVDTDLPRGGDEVRPERNWVAMRRSPVDEEIPGIGSADRDCWRTARCRPVEEAAPVRGARGNDWSTARRAGPTTAIFESRPRQDWALRSGPVDAVQPSAANVAESSQANTRRGPVDAVMPPSMQHQWAPRWRSVRTAAATPVRDFSFSNIRRGDWVCPEPPAVQLRRDVNFAAMRRGSNPLPSPPVVAPMREVDFSSIRQARQPIPHEMNFDGARRGAKLLPDKLGRKKDDSNSNALRSSSRDGSAPLERAIGAKLVATELSSTESHSITSAPIQASFRDWASVRRGHGMTGLPRTEEPVPSPTDRALLIIAKGFTTGGLSTRNLDIRRSNCH